MSGRLRPTILGCGLLLLGAIASGCHDGKGPRRYYALDPTRPGLALSPFKDGRLDVRRFAVDAQFASRALVYRLAQSEYQLDHYNEILVAPALMITEKTRTWLSQSGLFAQVMDPGSLSLPTHSLEGAVTALYGDFRDKIAPSAVIEVRCFLVRHGSSGDAILMGQTYQSRMPLETGDAPGLVAAYDRCLVQVLTRLEQDLRITMSRPPRE